MQAEDTLYAGYYSDALSILSGITATNNVENNYLSYWTACMRVYAIRYAKRQRQHHIYNFGGSVPMRPGPWLLPCRGPGVTITFTMLI